MSDKVLVVIPARLQSRRLPRKLLLAETGKTVLQHTWEAARRSERADHVVIACDSQELQGVATCFGAATVLTDPDLPTGTDRVEAAARQLGEYPIVVNVQADQPELTPNQIDLAVAHLETAMGYGYGMSTLGTRLRDEDEWRDPDVAKVVTNIYGQALYFSRAPIPATDHDYYSMGWMDCSHLFLRHVGIYAYRRWALGRYVTMPPSKLEQVERLEQLRCFHLGIDIGVTIVDGVERPIDTAEDYAAFVERWRQGDADELRK